MRTALVASLLIVSSVAHAQQDPCATADCSGHGSCFDERGTAHCLCDAGYAEMGRACRPDVDGEQVSRSRHAPGVGERVVAVAVSQVGRRLGQVGDRDDSLSAYLSAEEWWCGDFVSWVYARAGVPLSGGSAGGWLVTNNQAIAAWYEQRGLYYRRTDTSFTPRPGDTVRLPTDRGGHAAIVREVMGSTLTTVEGNVGGRVVVSTYYDYRHNRLIEGFGRLELDNDPPSIDAGDALEVVLGRGAALEADVEDDGPLEALDVSWIGARSVRFDDASSLQTVARFDAPGSYLLRLRVDDGEHVVTDDVRIDVVENEPPTVSARFDREAGELIADITDDGRSGPLDLRWELVSGGARIDDPGAQRTTVRFEGPGPYAFRLVATDGEHEASADLDVEIEATLGTCSSAPGVTSSGPLWLIGLLLTRSGRSRRRLRCRGSRRTDGARRGADRCAR